MASINGAFTLDRTMRRNVRPSVRFELCTFPPVSGKASGCWQRLNWNFTSEKPPPYIYIYFFSTWPHSVGFFTVSRTNCVEFYTVNPCNQYSSVIERAGHSIELTSPSTWVTCEINEAIGFHSGFVPHTRNPIAEGENRLIDWELRTQNISQWRFIESNRKQLGMFAGIVLSMALRNCCAHSREY